MAGGKFQGGSFPWGQLSGGGGHSSRGQLPRGQFSLGVIVLEPFCINDTQKKLSTASDLFYVFT